MVEHWEGTLSFQCIISFKKTDISLETTFLNSVCIETAENDREKLFEFWIMFQWNHQLVLHSFMQQIFHLRENYQKKTCLHNIYE